jgi:methyl-accepting chemotaxis protein
VTTVRSKNRIVIAQNYKTKMKRSISPTTVDDDEQPNSKIARTSTESDAVQVKGSTDLSQHAFIPNDSYTITGMKSLSRYLDTLDQYSLMRLVLLIASDDYSMFDRINQSKQKIQSVDANNEIIDISLQQIDDEYSMLLDSEDAKSVIECIDKWRTRAQQMLTDDNDVRNAARIIYRLTEICARDIDQLSNLQDLNITDDAIDRLAEDWRDILVNNKDTKQRVYETLGNADSLKEKIAQWNNIFRNISNNPTTSFEDVFVNL